MGNRGSKGAGWTAFAQKLGLDGPLMLLRVPTAIGTKNLVQSSPAASWIAAPAFDTAASLPILWPLPDFGSGYVASTDSGIIR